MVFKITETVELLLLGTDVDTRYNHNLTLCTYTMLKVIPFISFQSLRVDANRDTFYPHSTQVIW